jgi:HK97 family phage prohead protease
MEEIRYKNHAGNDRSIKDVDTGSGIVTGYFAAFNVIDSDGDKITKGAFTKTIAERGPKGQGGSGRIKHMLDHDWTKVVGVIQVLKEDDYGLYFESKAGSHTLGQDYLKMCYDEIITEHSFGYKIIKEENTGDYWHLKELMMYEGTAMQSWGANEFTPVTGFKSYKDIVQQFEALGKALQRGTYSDDGFKAIEAAYKQLAVQIKTTQPEPTTAPSDIAAHIFDGFKSELKC